MLFRVPAMAEYNGNMTGIVHSLETFGSVDGPGVRFVVFLQGCNMRCKYCHNPETWSREGGEEWTAQDLFDRAWRYKNYWGKNGGITVSGGEPLVQIDFVTEFFRIAKEHGVHTTLDTAGQPFREDPEFLKKFDDLLSVTDLVMLDLKEIDEDKHRELTGVGNKNILRMAEYISEKGVRMWIRHVLVPDLTDERLEETYAFIQKLGTVDKVEILPYHTLGLFKWEKLGIDYPLSGYRTPDNEEIERARSILHAI